jgi:hypothetical protein
MRTGVPVARQGEGESLIDRNVLSRASPAPVFGKAWRTEPIFNFDRQLLLLLAVNLCAARDAFGHDDRSRGVAVCSAAFVLRTLP